MRMNRAVYSDVPHLAAVSRRGSASAMHSANAIQDPAGSLDLASSEPVLAENVRAHPRHSQRRPPSRPRPLRTNSGHPHSGQRSGSPGAGASSAAMAALSSATSSLFSGRVSLAAISDTMGSMGPSFLAFFLVVEQCTGGPLPVCAGTGLSKAYVNAGLT